MDIELNNKLIPYIVDKKDGEFGFVVNTDGDECTYIFFNDGPLQMIEYSLPLKKYAITFRDDDFITYNEIALLDELTLPLHKKYDVVQQKKKLLYKWMLEVKNVENTKAL